VLRRCGFPRRTRCLSPAPRWIGSNASLNLFVGLVAGSGIGKGVAERVAEDAFVWGAIHEAGIGSGEGINHLFAHHDRATGSA
jgi:hypothetical protein